MVLLQKEEVQRRLGQKTTTIFMTGEYKRGKKATSFFCSKCDHHWEATPVSVLKSPFCPRCEPSFKKAHRFLKEGDYLAKARERNPNLKVLGHYAGGENPIRCFCTIHKIEFVTKANYVTQGKTCCPACIQINIESAREKAKLTNEEFLARLKKKHPDIMALERYKNYSSRVKCRCLVDDTVWFPTPSDLLAGKGCPTCARAAISAKRKKDSSLFERELAAKNPNLIIESAYNGSQFPIQVRCKDCGYKWSGLANNFLRGRGCPSCRSSFGEKRIESFLKRENISFEKQKTFEGCGGKAPYRFDFYLPKFNTCIEYDGEQHFKPIECWGGEKGLKETQYRDAVKTKFCEQQNISLLRIKYTEITKIEKIILEYITHTTH